jgi:predicted RNA-binding Zn-ribbon protein involved in translation (DUF1610 family)
MIRCPDCGAELNHAFAISRCQQTVSLDDGGTVIEWGSVDDILETIGFLCPYCCEDISKHIQEK